MIVYYFRNITSIIVKKLKNVKKNFLLLKQQIEKTPAMKAGAYNQVKNRIFK